MLVSPGDGPFPAGRGALDRDDRRHWARRSCDGRRRREVRAIAERLRPDVIMERYYNFGGEGIVNAARWTRSPFSRSMRRSSIYPGSSKALLDRALLVRPMQRWRERSVPLVGRDRHTEREHPSARHAARRRSSKLEWGADTVRFHPGATGPLPFTRPADVVAVFAGAFRSWHGAINLARADATASCTRTDECRRGVHRRWTRTAGRSQAEAAGLHRHRLHRSRAARPHAGLPGGRRYRRRAVRPRRAQTADARLLLVAAEDLRIHGGRPPGRGTRCRTDSAARSRAVSKDCSTSRAHRWTDSPRPSSGSPTAHCGSGSERRLASAPFANTAGAPTARHSTGRCAR